MPESIIELASGWSLRTEPGENVRLCDPDGREVERWELVDHQLTGTVLLSMVLGAAAGTQHAGVKVTVGDLRAVTDVRCTTGDHPDEPAVGDAWGGDEEQPDQRVPYCAECLTTLGADFDAQWWWSPAADMGEFAVRMNAAADKPDSVKLDPDPGLNALLTEMRDTPEPEDEKTWTYSQVNRGGADITHGFTFTGTDAEWTEHLADLTHQGIEPYNAKITAPVTALGSEPTTDSVK